MYRSVNLPLTALKPDLCVRERDGARAHKLPTIKVAKAVRLGQVRARSTSVQHPAYAMGEERDKRTLQLPAAPRSNAVTASLALLLAFLV